MLAGKNGFVKVSFLIFFDSPGNSGMYSTKICGSACLLRSEALIFVETSYPEVLFKPYPDIPPPLPFNNEKKTLRPDHGI